MNIEQIDTKRILISLSDKDMENYSLTFETLSLAEINSRKVLKELLNSASIKTGMSFTDKRVIIEALKYEHGCILLLTVLKKKDKRKIYRIKSCIDPYIFVFDSAESFLACIKALYSISGGRIISSAYTINEKYYLVIGCTSILRNKYINTVYEFSEEKKHGGMFAAVLKEHATIIPERNAVEEIGRLL